MAKKQSSEDLGDYADASFAEESKTTEIHQETTEAVSRRDIEPCVYCGPTLPRRIVSMTIYRGDLPANIKALAEEIPEIKKLIVPVTRLNETKRKSDTLGTEENRLYQVIQSRRSS
jgi:hypothetical protein